MKYHLSEQEQSKFLSTEYLPIPIGELLRTLTKAGFDIDIQTYQFVLAALQASFPDGLPIQYSSDGVGIVSSNVRQRLSRLLSPIVVTSPEEQQRFSELFKDFDEWPFLGRTTKSSVNHRFEIGRRDSQVSRNKFYKFNYILWVLWLTILFGTCAYISYHLPEPKITISQTKSDDSRKIKYSYVDEHFYPVDSVQWVFSDSSHFTVSNGEMNIDHIFSRNGSFAIKAHRHGLLRFPLNVLLLKRRLECKDSTLSFLYKPESFATNARYKPEKMPLVNMKSYDNILVSDWRLILLFIILAIPLIIIIILLLFKRKRVGRKLNNAPPLVLILPDQEKYIRANSYMFTWGQKLNQREESERTVIDIKASIRHRMRQAGMPELIFKTVKQKATYVFLVDASTPANQQLYLCRYLSRFLKLQEVELEVFYFSYSPRTCWNEKHYRGISLDDIVIKYKDSRMVLFSRVENLIDHTTLKPHSWFQQATNGWKQKAILTYNAPSNWTIIEKALAEFFLLLPITPEGQLQMAEFFQSDALPSSEHLKQFVKKSERSRDKLLAIETRPSTLQEILSIMQLHEDPKLNGILFQWACATLLYPEPSWEVTLIIGKELDKNLKPGGILTAENLTLLTTIPWIQGKSISWKLRERLIRGLEKKIYVISLAALEVMLTDPMLETLPFESVAYEEKRVRLTELMVRSHNRSKSRKGKNFLTTYLQSGLMKDQYVIAVVRHHARQREILQVLFFLLALVSATWVVWRLVTKPTNTRLWARSEQLIDSAAFYNNRACYIYAEDVTFSSNATYDNILSALKRSRKHRSTFPERYNYLTTVFNRGVAIHERDSTGETEKFLTSNESRGFDILLEPIAQIIQNYDYVPNKNMLKIYFELISQDSTQREVEKLVTDSSKTKMTGRYFPPDLSEVKYISLFEPFFYADSVGLEQRDSLFNQYAQLTLLYKGGPKAIEVEEIPPGPDPSPDLGILNEHAGENISRFISSNLLLGSSYADVMKYEYGESVIMPAYTDQIAAVECEGLDEPIRYVLRPITETRLSSWYSYQLGNLTYTANNYVIYFFQYEKLIRQEVRIVLNDEQYLEVLNRLDIDDRILESDFSYYYERKSAREFAAITRPKGYDFTKIIIGTSASSQICTADWWVRNP